MPGTANPIAAGPVSQQALNFCCRDVAFEDVTGDCCGMAAGKCFRHAQALAFRRGVDDVLHGDREACGLQVLDPACAASAGRILVDEDGWCCCQRRQRMDKGQRRKSAEKESALIHFVITFPVMPAS
jgi:hypothetical protein